MILTEIILLYVHITEYRTVSGVAGPLVILDKVKVFLTYLVFFFKSFLIYMFFFCSKSINQ